MDDIHLLKLILSIDATHLLGGETVLLKRHVTFVTAMSVAAIDSSIQVVVMRKMKLLRTLGGSVRSIFVFFSEHPSKERGIFYERMTTKGIDSRIKTYKYNDRDQAVSE